MKEQNNRIKLPRFVYFFFHKILPFAVLSVTILGLSIPLGVPTPAHAWSAVTLIPTHAGIYDRSYTLLKTDPVFSSAQFPTIDAIKSNDWVSVSMTLTKSGPGPDIEGASEYSSHYLNPRLSEGKQGNATGAVMTEFMNLVNARNSGEADKEAHAAAWMAHFLSDVSTPYHTQGTTRTDIEAIYNGAGGSQASAVLLPAGITGPLFLSRSLFGHGNDFKAEIESFLSGTQGDWFDPWYWDGWPLAMETSSHVDFEALIKSEYFPSDVSGYSPLWSNASTSFANPVQDQAKKAAEFAQVCAQWTQLMVDRGSGFPIGPVDPIDVGPYLGQAVQSVATLWRASFTALVPTVQMEIPDANEPKKLRVWGTIVNTAREDVEQTQVKITVRGGTLKNGETEEIRNLGTIKQGGTKDTAWEVEATRIGYCSVKLEVIGRYYQTPDLQYAVTEAIAPGVVPVEISNPDATLNYSIVFCLDNSGSMNGQPIIDARSAGVQAVNSVPSSGVEMALYFFGVSGCDVNLIEDFTTQKQPLISAINGAVAYGSTPLAAAISAAGQYIKNNAKGRSATIILLTDGEETCDGDPVAAARALNAKTTKNWSPFSTPVFAANDIPIKLEVVGFNITSPSIEQVLNEIAQAGNGNYYSATGVQELTEALTEVIQKSSRQGITIELWWLIAGGAFILFLLVIILVRRKPVPRQVSTIVQATRNIPPAPIAPITINTIAQPQTIIFCSHCGFQAQPGAVFCIRCGNTLAVSATPPQDVSPKVQVYCPQCGAPNPSESVFCNKCGAAIQPGSTPHQGRVTEKTEKKVSWTWWLFPVFLAIVGGLIAWSAVKKDDPNLARRMFMLGVTITALLFWSIAANLGNF